MMRYLLAFLLLVLAPSGVVAQELTSEEIVQQLSPRPLTRDVRGVSVTPAENEPPPSVSIRVQFAFDSVQLETEALLALRNLGNALRDERLAAMRFQIVGHTDAVGRDNYNFDLSRRRAASVLDHLVFYYELDPARFESRGMGETQLLDPANPDSEANRRVEVISFPMN